jgi:hypothetical protein
LRLIGQSRGALTLERLKYLTRIAYSLLLILASAFITRLAAKPVLGALARSRNSDRAKTGGR